MSNFNPNENIQGLVSKHQLTAKEILVIQELNTLCNSYDGLYLILDRPMLEGYPGMSDESRYLLYYEQNRLIGFFILEGEGSEDREVVTMVHPNYRRRGIFSALLKTAKGICQRLGIEKLVLVCESASRCGKAVIAAIGAQYELAEYHMQLEALHERPPVDTRLQLKKAFAKDTAVLARLAAASFGRSEERSRQMIASRVQEPNRQFYIATLGKEAIGTLNLYTTDRTIGIYGFGVPPEYQGKGYGRQMLQQIVHMIRAESQKAITLEVDTENTNAVGLYRSCGFKEMTTYGYYSLDGA